MAKELSQAQINALLKMAGKKLGTDPETIRKSLENGNVDNLLKNSNNDQLKQALGNPD